MTQSDGPFVATRDDVDKEVSGRQERNRLWWERMPMTYAGWSAKDRLPRTPDHLLDIERLLLSTSPFLRAWLAEHRFAGKRVVDIGCGSGVMTCRLARDGADMVGIDLTEAAVTLARRNADVQQLPVGIARMDAERLAFPGSRFDFVFSWGVLHHSADMEKAVREAVRVLMPGGQGLIMVYHRHSIVYYLHGLYWLLVRGKFWQGFRLNTVQRFYTDGYHHRYLTGQELSQMVTRAGARIERVSVTQYEKKIVPGVPAFVDRWLKSRFGMLVIAEFSCPAS